MSAPWLIIQHVAWEGPGLIASEAVRRGIAFQVVRMDLGQGLPMPHDLLKWEGLIVMGGPMSVNDIDVFPNLDAEIDLLAAAVKVGLPVLGICLGAQLLANALGARVYRGAAPEVGFGKVCLTPEGASDPVLGFNPDFAIGRGIRRRMPDFFVLKKLVRCFGIALTFFVEKASASSVSVLTPIAKSGFNPELPVVHWHEETFDLPINATLLATTALCGNQAFRVGSMAYGFQFHVEIDAELAEAWTPKLPNGVSLNPSDREEVEYAGRRVIGRFFKMAVSHNALKLRRTTK
jgi:GMP synthase (glutamine-hydrolysing)